MIRDIPILLLMLLLLSTDVTIAAEPLSVFVSVVPQQTFVERIGGAWVRVQSMVRPGDNPHVFEPTPRQVAALAGADLYIRIGIPFEDAWMPRILAANPDLRVLDVREGIERLPDADGHAHDEHGHEHADTDHPAMDMHLWTSPPLVKAMGDPIRDALSTLDPAHAGDFAANSRQFAADLDALDTAIRARLAGVTDRRFLVFHPAWAYFAKTYDLTQVPIEREGKEPGPRALAALIEQARQEGIRVIFVQPQFPRRAAEQVALAIGGRVEVADPLAADYFGNLRRVADLIAGTNGP